MKKRIYLSIGFILAFGIWTVLLGLVDVEAIGPNGSSVGFATLNGWFHERIGVCFLLYTITDWLGLVPIAVALAFAGLGVCQWIKRKSLLKVDRSLFVLGAFYIAVIVAYIFFEMVVINYRPVLINGYLEASYPSSTTMLVACVMPTAIMQLNSRIKNKTIKKCVICIISAFIAFMVIGRLVSGVHWFSDIIGGILLSAGLVTAYKTFA